MAGAGKRSKPAAVLAREKRGTFLAIYLARVRVTVHADGATIVVKAMAPAKAAAPLLARFTTSRSRPRKPTPPSERWRHSGNLRVELYRGGKTAAPHKHFLHRLSPAAAEARVGFHPDDTTPIPRPSRYYGRRQNQLAEHFRGERRQVDRNAAPPLAPAHPICFRLRSIKASCHRRTQTAARQGASEVCCLRPCLVCGRQPSDPHHLRFAQPERLD